MRKNYSVMLVVASALLTATAIPAALPASAQPRHDAPPRHEAAIRDFHGRNFRSLSRIERDQWIGGRWVHDWHGGRFGWWWAVGPSWYLYAEPVYPYPEYIPPIVALPPAPPPPAAGPAPWYYCDNPQGYFPYVNMCNGPWREVPSVPAAIPSRAG